MNSIVVATQIANTINNYQTANPGTFSTRATLPGGAQVDLTNASSVTTNAPVVGTAPVVTSAGSGPGGDITGLAWSSDNLHLYAVSDQGGFYEVLNPDDPNLAQLSYIPAAIGLAGIPFAGLTLGPQNVENGEYADKLFAVDDNGRLYAIGSDLTNGELGLLQPIFGDGRTSISLGLNAGVIPTGLAFSPIDYNLWHVTDRRGGDLGHGVDPTFDHDISRNLRANGGTSFYFGLEDPNPTTTISTQPGAGNWGTNNTVYQTYDVPGGAYGSITSQAFDLTGYAATDKPTLYFNYFLETENASSSYTNPSAMRDAMRVQVSTDGVNWTEVATNNSLRSRVPTPTEMELPVAATTSGGLYRADNPNQMVQELFDDPAGSGGWRQARIDLGDWAGRKNIKLRFDFSTGGSFNMGDNNGPGDALQALPGQDLRDGQVFNISGVNFEFDMGFSLVAPIGGGAVINDGETFRVSVGATNVLFEFDKNSSLNNVGATAIAIRNTDSPEIIAQKIEAAINASILPVIPHLNGNRLHLQGATAVVQSATPRMILEGNAPGVVTPGNVPIVIDGGMSATQVATAMADVIDARFSVVDDPNIYTSVKNEGTVLRTIGHNVNSAGPLPLSTSLATDFYGNYFTNGRGQRNDFEGPMIDDIIIGFAERGESITGNASGTNDTFFSVPTNPVAPGTQVLAGSYQFEVRRGTEYGVQNPPNPFAPPPPDMLLFQSFDTNDRLTSGLTLTALAPTQIAEGLTFSISDGINQVTFEFDSDGSITTGNTRISFGTAVTAADVAQRMVTAINSAKATNGASLLTKASAVASSNRVDLINAQKVDAGLKILTPGPFLERNDTLTNAFVTGMGPNNDGQMSINGAIGDNPFLTGNNVSKDVDFVRFDLNSGNTISIDVDTRSASTDPDSQGSTVRRPDFILEIFDAFGNFINLSDDDSAPGEPAGLDPYLSFTAPATGTYYAAVSGYSNFNYDPFTEGSGVFFTVPFSTGSYTLTLQLSTQQQIGTTQYQFLGDSNLARDQGYVVVRDNLIRDSLNWGVMVDNAPRTVNGDLPHTGSSRNLTVPSTQNLVPGITVLNNVITYNGSGGIMFSGDSGAGPTAAVPFGRIVNNTIYGGATAVGDGILVTDFAGPTVLNNIIARSANGLRVDASSQATTVSGENLYQNNGVNRVGIAETFNIDLLPTDPLFVDPSPAARNFYLAAGSQAIDSALDSLQERTSLKTVANDIGIPDSPILAPSRDLFGQLRVDDPNAQPPQGLGSNVFKDRGALDRADFVGPSAQLFNPIDNDGLGNDQDSAINVVRLTRQPLSNFAIQLLDPSGIGIDDASVDSTKFSITYTDNGTPPSTITLTEFLNYTFSYDKTNKIVRFDPTAGVWLSGTYVVTLQNTTSGSPPVSPIRDIAGNPLKSNQANGSTSFKIILSNSTSAPWQNPNNPYDVTGEGAVNGLDAQQLVTALNTYGVKPLPANATPPPYLDVDGDGILTGLDLSLVIAYLNTPHFAKVQTNNFLAAAPASQNESSSSDSSPNVAFALASSSSSNSTPAAAPTPASFAATNPVLSPEALNSALDDDDYSASDNNDSSDATATDLALATMHSDDSIWDNVWEA